MALQFDDYSLPIKFNTQINDDQYVSIIDNSRFMWELAADYFDFFVELDMSPGDTIQFNDNLPFTTDISESE